MEIESWLREKGADCSTELVPSLVPGDVVSGWMIRAHLATGGTAEVYRVERDGDEAALKIAREIEQPRVDDRFAREADLLRALDDPAFPKFITQGFHAGRPFLVTEFLQPLELPSKDGAVAALAVRLADALGRLHALGYVHRDVKPANVLTRDGTTPVLVDLGYARPFTASDASDGASRLSVERSRVVGLGTPGYAAPEQFSGLAVTPATDIHALGVLLADCFNGHPPQVWQPLVRRATSSLPAQRYESMAVFARAVRRRHLRRCLVFASLAVLSLLAAVSLALIFLSRTAERQARAEIAAAAKRMAEQKARDAAVEEEMRRAAEQKARDVAAAKHAAEQKAHDEAEAARRYDVVRRAFRDLICARDSVKGYGGYDLGDSVGTNGCRVLNDVDCPFLKRVELDPAEDGFGHAALFLDPAGRIRTIRMNYDTGRSREMYEILLDLAWAKYASKETVDHPDGGETRIFDCIRSDGVALRICYRRRADSPGEIWMDISRPAKTEKYDAAELLERFKTYDANLDPADTSARGTVKDLLGKALSGDASSMLQLGVFYCEGRDVTASLDRAEYWYHRAWAAGSSWGLYDLARLYLDHPESRSVTVAVRLLEALSGNANFGYPGKYALWDLGRCHQEGIGTPKDEEKAATCWWRLLSVLPPGRETVTSRTLQDYRRNATEALKKMGRLPPIQGCIGGDLDDAAFLVQFKHYDGTVEPYDPAATGKAKEILEKLRSGNLKSPRDLCVLGWDYLHGWYIARDPVRAEYWFRRAWRSGEPWGVFTLAENYLDGTLGVRSPETAFRIFRVLSENPRYGYVQRYALCELGRCYQYGIGTAENPEKAREAYERALRGYDSSPKSRTARAYRAAAEYGLKILDR